jgi:hypothetical protein
LEKTIRLAHSYSEPPLVFELSENLGKVSSFYWLVSTGFSNCALTFSIHEVVLVLELFTWLYADAFEPLASFTPGKI